MFQKRERQFLLVLSKREPSNKHPKKQIKSSKKLTRQNLSLY